MVRVLGKLEPGGAQLAVLRVTRALAEHHGVATTLLVGDATDDGLALARRHGVTVSAFRSAARLHPTRNLQWELSDRFADWLAPRMLGADLVHAHMVGAWWAAGTARTGTVPFVASEHNEVRWSPERVAALRPVARGVHRFYAMGPAAARFAVAAGVHPGLVHPARSPVEGLGTTAVPGPPSPRLTFTGRLERDKGADVLVEALALLARTDLTAHLLGDGSMRTALRARTVELGLAGRVHLPGWTDEPWTTVAGSTVHVVPSREEAWSQSAVLAMGLGVPVVGTDVDGLSDTLADRRGVLVAPDDPAELAAALDAVLAGTTRTDRAGARRYARRFSPERVAAHHLAAYRELVSTTAARHLPAGAPTVTGLAPGLGAAVPPR